MVGVTLRFDYPWNDEKMDENEIRDCLTELPPEVLLYKSFMENIKK